jgi:hypothetical protein
MEIANRLYGRDNGGTRRLEADSRPAQLNDSNDLERPERSRTIRTVVNEDKSARYHRLRRRRASIAGTLVSVVFLIAFVWSGASASLRDVAASLVGATFIPTLVIYVVLLGLLNEAISLPFAFYEGVTLERRYGLLTQTTARWWLDHVKAGLVALVFGLAAALIVCSLIRWQADRWWVLPPSCSPSSWSVWCSSHPCCCSPCSMSSNRSSAKRSSHVWSRSPNAPVRA